MIKSKFLTDFVTTATWFILFVVAGSSLLILVKNPNLLFIRFYWGFHVYDFNSIIWPLFALLVVYPRYKAWTFPIVAIPWMLNEGFFNAVGLPYCNFDYGFSSPFWDVYIVGLALFACLGMWHIRKSFTAFEPFAIAGLGWLAISWYAAGLPLLQNLCVLSIGAPIQYANLTWEIGWQFACILAMTPWILRGASLNREPSKQRGLKAQGF